MLTQTFSSSGSCICRKRSMPACTRRVALRPQSIETLPMHTARAASLRNLVHTEYPTPIEGPKGGGEAQGSDGSREQARSRGSVSPSRVATSSSEHGAGVAEGVTIIQMYMMAMPRNRVLIISSTLNLFSPGTTQPKP